MPKSKNRRGGKKSTRSPRLRPVQATDMPELDEGAVIRVMPGRRALPAPTVVPGPGNRAGVSDGTTSFMPNAVIFDLRLDPYATVNYGRLLIENPPFQLTWDELVDFCLAMERHPDDSADDVRNGLEQLREHGYLVPCENGWTLDVPDDAADHAHKWDS